MNEFMRKKHLLGRVPRTVEDIVAASVFFVPVSCPDFVVVVFVCVTSYVFIILQ